jgi:hypothetical protein
MSKIRDFISESNRKSVLNPIEFMLFNKILVKLKDPLPEGVNLYASLKKLEALLPMHLFEGLRGIIIGNFEEIFSARKINAFYNNGTLFITNKQSNESDLLDDIVHEIAHLTEENYEDIIYKDEKIKKEYMSKKKRIYLTTKNDGIDLQSDFLTPNFDQNMDLFLYKTVGYKKLNPYCKGLFLSPYSLTSLREYYAEGFEEYFLGDKRYLKNIAPAVYEKITIIAGLGV